MTTLAEARAQLEEVTPILADLNRVRTQNTGDLRSAVVRAYDYYIGKLELFASSFAQSPTGSPERTVYEQLERMKGVRSGINQSEEPALGDRADEMIVALKETKRALEQRLRDLQPAGGRRRKTRRRRRATRRRR